MYLDQKGKNMAVEELNLDTGSAPKASDGAPVIDMTKVDAEVSGGPTGSDSEVSRAHYLGIPLPRWVVFGVFIVLAAVFVSAVFQRLPMMLSQTFVAGSLTNIGSGALAGAVVRNSAGHVTDIVFSSVGGFVAVVFLMALCLGYVLGFRRRGKVV
jgi:hypothetical protein